MGKPNPDALLHAIRTRPKEDAAADRLARLAEAGSEAVAEAPCSPGPINTQSPAVVSGAGEGAPLQGSILQVPVDRFLEGPSQSRKFYLESRIEERAKSLKEQGQLEAVKAYYEDGFYVLLEGHYRWKAARVAGLESLRTEICARPVSALAAYEFSRTMNRERASLTVLDDAFRMRELEESRAVTRDDLMKVTGYEKHELSRLLSITKLPESIILAVMETPALLTVRFLYALAQFHEHAGPTEVSRIVAEAVENGMTARELERRLATVQRAPRGRPRSQQISLERGNAKGFIKAFPGGRVELRLDGLTDDEQESLVGRLRGVLGPSNGEL